jgi:hypothetical protein
MKSKLNEDLVFLIPFLGFLVVLAVMALPLGIAATSQEATSPSNATVNVWVEMTLGDSFSSKGIAFGNVDPNTADNVATGNNGTGITEYNVTAGAANNVAIDLCVKDSVALTRQGGAETIPNAGYTYDWDATDTGSALPGTAITTSYFKTDHTGITAGSLSYAKFWLDIPAAQTAGVYNNTVYIKAIQTSGSC